MRGLNPCTKRNKLSVRRIPEPRLVVSSPSLTAKAHVVRGKPKPSFCMKRNMCRVAPERTIKPFSRRNLHRLPTHIHFLETSISKTSKRSLQQQEPRASRKHDARDTEKRALRQAHTAGFVRRTVARGHREPRGSWESTQDSTVVQGRRPVKPVLHADSCRKIRVAGSIQPSCTSPAR